MRSLLRLIVYIPLGLIFLFFALANRQPVRISLNPFPGGELSGPSFEASLFLVVLAAMALGVIAGAFSSWLNHRQVRRTAREARAEVARATAEIERLRGQSLANPPSSSGRNVAATKKI